MITLKSVVRLLLLLFLSGGAGSLVPTADNDLDDTRVYRSVSHDSRPNNDKRDTCPVSVGQVGAFYLDECFDMIEMMVSQDEEVSHSLNR